MGLRDLCGNHILPQDLGLQDGYGLLILPGTFVFKSTAAFQHGMSVGLSKCNISWKRDDNANNCSFNIGFLHRSFSGHVIKKGMYPCYGAYHEISSQYSDAFRVYRLQSL
jgi:hypothetical protein